MKKKFLNDFYAAIIFPGIALVSASTLITIVVLIASSAPWYAFVIVGIPLGGIVICAAVGFALTFELITFYDDRLVSSKFRKRIEIKYVNVVAIKEVDKKWIDSLYSIPTWEVLDSNQNAIYVVRAKWRRKYIEQIKNQ